MERTQAVEAINEMQPTFLPKARKRGWICPSCGNGSGRDGDGIVRNPKTGKYKCFKCGAGGDILDLIEITFGLSDFNTVLNKGADIYGITIDRYHPSHGETTNPKPSTLREIVTLLPAEDISGYLKTCHDRVDQTDYYTSRGISRESIDRFGLGYDPAYDEGNVGRTPWKAAIIPTSEDTFEARNVSVTPNSEENGKNKYRKHGSNRLFNLSSLQEEKEKPIVICEGVFDALSVIECGGQAIALGSAVNYRSLLSELDLVQPSKPLILLLDNDDAGRENSAKLAKELETKKVRHLLFPEILGEYHDANERLLKDRDGLRLALAEAYQKTEAISDKTEDAKAAYLNTSAGSSLKQFIDCVQSNRNRFRMSSGFAGVDQALGGGIYTGLYILGAISSLGKTSLTLQIADNLAAQGKDVLYFTLEQSRYDLMSKSISRETYLYCQAQKMSERMAKSNLSILDANKWDHFDETEKAVVNAAFAAYSSYAKRIFLFEGIGSITVAEIRERVREHISITGNEQPVVFVDYLQILKAGDDDRHASDKQVVDHNITALKHLSRDFNIPVIAVSSLNRANYGERINMAAFKESGAIEYGADVLIGLQLTGAGEAGFDAEKAKEQNPRKIDFCVLKHRNGPVVSKGVQLIFYPAYNCFSEGKN